MLAPFNPQNESVGAPKWVKIVKITEYITFIQLLLQIDLHVEYVGLHIDSIEVKS